MGRLIAPALPATTTIAKVMSMSSLCGLGETAQNSLLSAMKKFPQVFDLGGARA